mmetsp:Transcript_62371/g.115774  ORF Transcript_62371/g.115774 Transcript_62371/m.115774 type:complete len:226 (-) Transcript_62371:98-775(-)
MPLPWVDVDRKGNNRFRIESLVNEGMAENKPAWLETIAPLPDAGVPDYLKCFGLSSDSHLQWHSNKPVGTRIELTLLGHEELMDHTWYVLECCISAVDSSSCDEVKPLRWKVARRLLHFRELLHDPVKSHLETAAVQDSNYDTLFADAKFARMGGIPGTSQRLDAWCRALIGHINTRAVSPHVAAVALRFLEAPFADSTSVMQKPPPSAPVARSMSRAHPEDIVD